MMQSLHAVARYAGVSIYDALDMPCDMFLLCLKNQVVDNLMQSEGGREYLDDCMRLSQTKMDREGLMRMRRGMGGDGTG